VSDVTLFTTVTDLNTAYMALREFAEIILLAQPDPHALSTIRCSRRGAVGARSEQNNPRLLQRGSPPSLCVEKLILVCSAGRRTTNEVLVRLLLSDSTAVLLGPVDLFGLLK